MHIHTPQWFYLSHVPRPWWELVLSLSAMTSRPKALIPDEEYLFKNCLQFWSFGVHVFRAGALPLSYTQRKGKGDRLALMGPFLATLLSGQRVNIYPEQNRGCSIMFTTGIYRSFKDKDAGSGSWVSLPSHKITHKRFSPAHHSACGKLHLKAGIPSCAIP